MKNCLIALAASIVLAGCASQIIHSEIANDLPAGTPISGIPYRTPKRFMAIVYEKGPGGYTELTRLPVTIPDPDRLYVLGFRSEPFSTGTLDVVVNADNTLQQVSLKSASTGSAAATAIGTQLAAINTAEQARVKSASDAETKAQRR